MIRTQVYLTKKERSALRSIAAQTGRKQSELIRQAIDELIARHGRDHREAVLRRTAGLWRGRKDLPEFREMRKEWDREGRS